MRETVRSPRVARIVVFTSSPERLPRAGEHAVDGDDRCEQARDAVAKGGALGDARRS